LSGLGELVGGQFDVCFQRSELCLGALQRFSLFGGCGPGFAQLREFAVFVDERLVNVVELLSLGVELGSTIDEAVLL